MLLGLRLTLALFVLYALAALTSMSIYSVAGAIAIACVAMLPALRWAAGRVPGLPIYPVAAITVFWTYGIPLVTGRSDIEMYAPGEIGLAIVSVLAFALAGLAAWHFTTRLAAPTRRYHYVLPDRRGFRLLIVMLVAAGSNSVILVAGLFSLDPGLVGIVRTVTGALSGIALFVLALRAGRGELSSFRLLVFAACAVYFVIMQLISLFMVGSIFGVAMLVLGYSIGSRRPPWVSIGVALVAFTILHAGKAEIRERYWEDAQGPIQMAEFPRLMAEWTVAGVRQLASPKDGTEPSSLSDRLSLMHMLLLAQDLSPDEVPFLEGSSYLLVPELLIPRFLYPDKPASHAGTSLLNVRYGIQSIEDTEKTTIGWGMPNEAYANFGIPGMIGLAIFLGLLYGAVERLTIGAPLMSLENMVGIVFASAAVQTEFTMGVFASALTQSLIALVVLVPLLERRRTIAGG